MNKVSIKIIVSLFAMFFTASVVSQLIQRNTHSDPATPTQCAVRQNTGPEIPQPVEPFEPSVLMIAEPGKQTKSL